MNSLRRKVALVTGAARGQGRSHVLGFAAAGVDVIAIDRCQDVPSIEYPMVSKDDLHETAALACRHGVSVVEKIVDVRNSADLTAAFLESVERLGGLGVVCINAGIAGPYSAIAEMSDEAWTDVIGVNLTGAFNSARAAVPFLRERRGGSIVFISSVGGLRGMAHLGAYVASKHGVLGLMKTMAIDLATDRIRVNAVLPTSVATPMLFNEPTYRVMRPDLEEPCLDDVIDVFRTTQLLPVPYMECEDVTNVRT